MSLMSVQFVADTTAFLFGKLSDLTPKSRRKFPEFPGRTRPLAVPTRHGEVSCTLYLPPESTEKRPPVYVNSHGGGFVIRFPAQDDPFCRYLAARAGIVVINVDYAVAPRSRFPIAVEQLYDVLQWVAGDESEWDGGRLCVGGQSAGGSLTAGTARLALENGTPTIALQVLHYPPLDLVTPPHKRTAEEKRSMLPPWMGEMFDTAYIPDPELRRHRLASPAWGSNADGIEGIAPALVITAEFDRLRDGAAAYARKLEAVGSLVEYRDVPGVDHGYNIIGGSEAITREMYEFIVEHVRRATAPSHPRGSDNRVCPSHRKHL